MNVHFAGVAIDGADAMPWTSHIAGLVASTAHPAIATHDAIAARTRGAAAATVASVHRGTT